MPRRLLPRTKDEWRWLLRSVFLIALTWALVLGVAGITALRYFEQQNFERAEENQRIVLALCRLQNEQRLQMQVTLLDLGVPGFKLRHLNTVSCNAKLLENR